MRRSPRRRGRLLNSLYHNSRGFSIVELIVVLAIISALAVITIPIYNHYVDKARLTISQSALDTFRKVMESYHIDYQNYPHTIDFTTGRDNDDRQVLTLGQLDQFNDDIAQVVSYNSSTTSYTLTVKAIDSNRTVMTATPHSVSK